MFVSQQQRKYSHIFNKPEFKAERFADTWTSSSGSAPVSHRCGAAALQARFCFRTDALLRIWGSRMAYSTWFSQNIGAFVVMQLCAVLDPPYSEGQGARLWHRPRLIDTFNIFCCFDETLRNEIPFFPPSGHPSANYTFLQSMLPLLFHHKV